MKKIIKQILDDSIRAKEEAFDQNTDKIVQAVDIINKALNEKGKLILFGNGGSAADSQHIAAEFIGRFQKERKSIAAIALTTDTSIITALSNDYNFDIIFERQIEGLGLVDDVAIAFSTSGNSKNVIEGLKKAKKIGMKTISFTGGDGGGIKEFSDVCLIVPSKNTARIQESHICMAHAICELVENEFSKQ